MQVLTSFTLCAALCACLPATASAQQLQLGRPLALSGQEQPDPGEQPPLLQSANVDEAVNDGETSRASQERRPLGEPADRRESPQPGGQPNAEAANTGPDAQSAFDTIGGDALQVISALAVVLGLIVTLRTVLLRGSKSIAGGGRPSGVLEILARYPVARGQHLVLLKIARRILLVHQSGQEMKTLSEMTDPDEVAALLARVEAGASSQREASRFRAMLGQFTREHERVSKSGDEIKDAWNDGEVVDLTRRTRRSGLFSRPEGGRA